MCLKANEYPDIWTYSDEHPAPPPDYPTTDRIHVFMDTFLNYNYYGRMVILGQSLYYRKIFHVNTEGFRVIEKRDEVLSLRRHLENICLGGHFSVIFVPLKPERFLEKILGYGHYGKPARISIGEGSPKDPLGFEEDRYQVSLLKSELFSDGEVLFAFSHDAQFLYEMFR